MRILSTLAALACCLSLVHEGHAEKAPSSEYPSMVRGDLGSDVPQGAEDLRRTREATYGPLSEAQHARIHGWRTSDFTWWLSSERLQERADADQRIAAHYATASDEVAFVAAVNNDPHLFGVDAEVVYKPSIGIADFNTPPEIKGVNVTLEAVKRPDLILLAEQVFYDAGLAASSDLERRKQSVLARWLSMSDEVGGQNLNQQISDYVATTRAALAEVNLSVLRHTLQQHLGNSASFTVDEHVEFANSIAQGRNQVLVSRTENFLRQLPDVVLNRVQTHFVDRTKAVVLSRPFLSYADLQNELAATQQLLSE